MFFVENKTLCLNILKMDTRPLIVSIEVQLA